MSGNRRKNPPKKAVETAEEPLAARVVAIPKGEEAAAPLSVPPPPEPKAKPKSERIGDILRQARLDKDDDLYLIAEYLRIKPAFLIALENSRYDEIPADAYVIGFLRTYANFLGVDGKDAVDRYRYEMAGRRKKPVLSMPTPVSEGRAPSGILLVGATVAVLLIYALWYGISSANRASVNIQPTLPTVVQPVPQVATPDSSAAAGLTAPLTTTAPAAVTAPAETAPTPAAPAPSSSSVNTVPVIPPAAPGIVVTAESPPTPKTEDMSAKAPKENSASTKPVKEVKETAKDAKPDTDSATNQKQVFGDPASVSRVIIKATQSSWVMITDGSGKTVFDHVLKAGDTYKVPNKPGLSLTTGNGSGIILSLDGADLPKVANGAPHVVRNIALDPDRLTAESPASDH